MRILCDMDGVLVNLLDTWLSEYRECTGETVWPSAITTYHFAAHVKQPVVLHRCLPSALRSAAPMPGAQAFAKLIEQHTVHIVTYVPHDCPSGFGSKLNWLADYFPAFDRDRVIFTKEKWKVNGDLLIEDNAQACADWLAAHPEGQVALMDAPYNREVKNSDRLTRVFDMYDVLTALEGKI